MTRRTPALGQAPCAAGEPQAVPRSAGYKNFERASAPDLIGPIDLHEPLGLDVVRAVRKEVKKLANRRKSSIRPVLVHVNGVTESVLQKDYFDQIIDYGALAFRD